MIKCVNFEYHILDVPQWLTVYQGVLERWSSVIFMEIISLKQREAIKNKKLSLLEFRCYLFSRQASLLMASSKPWQVSVEYYHSILFICLLFSHLSMQIFQNCR